MADHSMTKRARPSISDGTAVLIMNWGAEGVAA